ncbi:putative mucin/carbohydrate-binding domain-containing protein, partial [Bacillus cereus]|uniref:putative mucin/carbohydrate-binding domain-containing protein n=1 Tax=Bacillus cereus TaxID=1396 RepID=UPI0020D28A59
MSETQLVGQTPTFITQGHVPKEELRLPNQHFITAMDWIDKLGESAYCDYLKMYTMADRRDKDREYDRVPRALSSLWEALDRKEKYFRQKILIPLWEYGLVDLVEYQGEHARAGHKPMNIVIYRYPCNDITLLTKPLEKVRDWKTDYKSSGKFYAIKGGRPKNELKDSPQKPLLKDSLQKPLKDSPQNPINNTKELNNLLNYYIVQAPNNIEIELLLKKFETSPLVEEAYIQEKQILTPPEIQLPNLSVNPYDDPRFKNQGYLEAAPKGINASHAWSIKGGDGKDTTFVDMEYGWLLNHEDLVNKNIKLMSGQNISQHRAHGTSVLGIVSSEDNQIGNIGIAPKANVKVISQIRDNGIYNTADAILSAVHNLQAGDILLLEAQASYDGYGDKYLPVEVHPDIFDAIRVGTDKGIIIIEAGANGSNDLDNFKDRNGKKILNRNSPDFKDSGAIMVGAGSSTVPHQRLWFSNYGSRLDVYGWGENVDTTSANPSQNTTNLYTSTFSGTSSASPIIAGAATSIQGIAKEHRGSPYTPAELRNILSNPNTGTKSQDPWNDRIGVLPDLKSILDNLGFNSDIPNSSSILEGNQFAWSLKGISDFEFAKINFNKSTEEMQIDLKAGVPHHYFNQTYASIKVQNATGKVVYNKDIYGNKQQNAESQKVPVKVGDYIELTHLEGVHRATLINVDSSKQESFGKKVMYEVTKEGLKKVEKMPETTVLDGNHFRWSL